MKNWKQIVAALGAAVLIGTSVGSVPQVVYAETTSETGDTEDPEVKTEPEETKESTEEDEKGQVEAEKEKKTEETESEIKDETKEEDAETPEVTEQSEVKDETKEEVVEQPAVIEQSEIVNEEENGIMLLSDDIEIGGTETSESGVVNGSIPDGEDSSAAVTYKGSWKEGKVSVGGSFIASEDIASYNTDDYTVKSAFNLSYLVDGEEAEPGDPVTVSIDSWRLSSWSLGDAVTIYHIKDNGKREIVAMNAAVETSSKPDGGKVTFTTSSFSPFLLTDDYIDDVYIDASDATIQESGQIQAHILQYTGEESDKVDVDGYGEGWKDITERILATDGLTFTWSKTDANKNVVNIDKAAISDDKGSIQLVKDSDDDLGNGKLYTFTISDQSGNELASEPATVKYYKSFLNSSFEEPSIGNSSWSGVAMKSTKWTTTDSQGKVELGIYSNTSYDAHGAGLDYYNQDTNGKQYAELNANSAGTLYQDVLTYGDTDLSWSLLHRARTARKPTMKVGDISTVTDNMYAVIMSKDDAEQVSATQADIEAMIADVTQDGKAHDYTVPGTDKTVKVTVWKISTKTTTEKTANGAINSSAKGDEDSLTGTYSDTTGWAQYKGSYTVPEGQYLTRFFFVAGKTGNNNKAVGNLLDEVYFAQAIPVGVKGTIDWVDRDDVDGIRPDDLTITVYDGNGKSVGTAKVTIDENGNWTYALDGLNQYDDDGNEIAYTVKVTSVDGYEAEIKETENGTVITMTHEPETSVSGKITWVDNDDADGVRPEDVTVVVYDEDGNKVGEVKVTADEDGNWTYSLDGLPRYDDDGEEIQYKVGLVVGGDTENGLPDYYGYEQDGNDIVCAYKPAVRYVVSNTATDKDGNPFLDENGKPVKADPPVRKVIEGDKPSSDTTFEFTMVPDDKSGPLPVYNGVKDHTTVTIVGEGEAEFGDITFTKEGTYSYTITETVENKDGYTYDDAAYKVTYVVTRDSETKELSVTRELLRDSIAAEKNAFEFVNTYEAPSSDKGSKHSDGKKTESHNGGGYAGVDFYLVDDATTAPLGTGTFALYTAAGELVGTYTTDANGHIAFPNLKGGTYYLEQISAPDGYAVNGTRLTFTVNGTDLALMLTNKALGAAATDATVAADAGAVPADGQGAVAGAENGAAVGGATGDSSNMMVYGAAAAVAAVLLAVWIVMNRRRANH